jgi:methionine sulfoxide reductase heme-binding subunit
LTEKHIRLIKAALFVLCLWPLAYYVLGFEQDALGANPIEAVTRGMGLWALRFLLITLTVTPLRKLAHLPWLGRLRRMLGLFTFFYASLHLMTYVWFDQFFDWGAIAKDILKRPFITAGMIAFVLMVPLAVTSSNAMVRRLGGRRWQELHRTIYAIAMIAVLHFWWMVKLDTREPMIYGLIVAALLGIRFWWREQERRRQLAGAYLPKRQSRVIPINTRR